MQLRKDECTYKRVVNLNDDQESFNKEERVGSSKEDSLRIIEVRQVKQNLVSLKEEVLGFLRTQNEKTKKVAEMGR